MTLLTTLEQTAARPRGPILDRLGDAPAFRAALRAWLEDAAARRKALVGPADEDFAESQRWWMTERQQVGLVTPHWPSSVGGADMDLGSQVILAEELARARIPDLSMFMISLHHVPATLLHWGSEEQRRKYLPPVLDGAVWCQGFSEPGAGSDLAALRTRAVRDGDHYVINGHKTWSSYSMFAEKCILLARTDPEKPKHKGISFFLMDMKAPGVEVRPVKQINGQAEFGELFLTDVRIPVEDLVGQEGQGWQIAQTTLAAERGVILFELGERLYYLLTDVHAAAVAGNSAWLHDAEQRRAFIRLVGELQASRGMLRGLMRKVAEDSPEAPGMIVRIKVIFTQLLKAIGDFLVSSQGVEGQLFWPASANHSWNAIDTYLHAFVYTIAGGTNEIMRNLIAERFLGMPKG